MLGLRMARRPGRLAALASLLARVALLAALGAPPGALLSGCATKGPESAEIPKPAPAVRSDRAEDRVDEECPDCLGPGESTVPQEEEE
jgi:hypothetical protein